MCENCQQQSFFDRSTLFEKKWPICVFEPLGGLGATYAVHLRLIEKLIVDFLLVIIEPFFVDVRAEALRANIDWKSPFLKRWGQFGPKISGT